MQEDLSSKEHKWTAALSKLQEQVEIQIVPTETRSQKCRRISAARSTSGQLPSPSFRNRQDHQDAGGFQQHGTQVDKLQEQTVDTKRDKLL
jgi:hypothetical protein